MRQNIFQFMFLVFFAVIIVYSCDQRRIYEKYTSIPGAIWKRDNIITYNINISDTVTPHNLLVDIRNKGNYRFSNLFLFITISSPDARTVRDTFECFLADEKGKWLGRGIGDIYDNQIPYKKNIVFPKKGKYIFRIEQAMRVEYLADISDVGFRIEKAN
jgi:gliding motility-associated lipoprotein GldH